MNKQNNSELDDFLGGEKVEVKDPFDTKVETPFKEGEVPEDKEPELDEKPVPFNKDPKITKFIEKEISKRLKDFRPQSETHKFIKEAVEEGDGLTSVLERIVGNDTPEKKQAVKDLRKELMGLEEKGAERAMSKLREQEAAQVEEERLAQEELSEGFDNVEETFGVDLTSNTPASKKMRNDFIDFIKRVAPKDEDGEVTQFPDLVSTFELFQERSKVGVPASSRAKELSNRSMARSSDVSNQPASTDQSWKAVDKKLASMTK